MLFVPLSFPMGTLAPSWGMETTTDVSDDAIYPPFDDVSSAVSIFDNKLGLVKPFIITTFKSLNREPPTVLIDEAVEGSALTKRLMVLRALFDEPRVPYLCCRSSPFLNSLGWKKIY